MCFSKQMDASESLLDSSLSSSVCLASLDCSRAETNIKILTKNWVWSGFLVSEEREGPTLSPGHVLTS